MALIAPDPVCVILAGPNGAGKSTLFNEAGSFGLFVNADDIARDILPHNPEGASLEAGRRVIHLLRRSIKNRENFTYETTLSSHHSLNVMRDARSANYQIELVFVALRSAELHVKRVATRVAQGGHGIPKDVIARRYDLSFRNLEIAIPLADRVSIYDNSSELGANLLLALENGEEVINRLSLDRNFDRRVSDLITAAKSTAK